MPGPLNARQVGDLQRAMGRAYAAKAMPVLFERYPTGSTDPLYREALVDTPTPYATLKADVVERAHPELLTKFGLSENTEWVLIIPQEYVRAWEATTGVAFVLTEGMTVVFKGVRKHIQEVRDESLPVQGSDTPARLCFYVGAVTKPRVRT